MNISEEQRGIIPSIEEVIKEHEEITYMIQDKDIVVDAKELPFSFTFSYFERFGWQAFLVPKSSLVEEDFSHNLYQVFQNIATSYNHTLRIYEKPESHLFSI